MMTMMILLLISRAFYSSAQPPNIQGGARWLYNSSIAPVSASLSEHYVVSPMHFARKLSGVIDVVNKS